MISLLSQMSCSHFQLKINSRKKPLESWLQANWQIDELRINRWTIQATKLRIFRNDALEQQIDEMVQCIALSTWRILAECSTSLTLENRKFHSDFSHFHQVVPSQKTRTHSSIIGNLLIGWLTLIYRHLKYLSRDLYSYFEFYSGLV